MRECERERSYRRNRADDRHAQLDDVEEEQYQQALPRAPPGLVAPFPLEPPLLDISHARETLRRWRSGGVRDLRFTGLDFGVRFSVLSRFGVLGF